jgi:fructose-1,6-bisphosphatase-3
MSLKRDEALIFHGCLPSEEDGSFREVEVGGKRVAGGELFHELEQIVRRAYREGAHTVGDELDWFYWLWANGNSPLFGKARMTTFERYFIEDSSTHQEKKDPYFRHVHDAEFCKRVGADFGMGKDVLIVNGHVPVKVEKGEDPVKEGGNAVTIDGAFSEAYGDHGYTLVMGPNHIRLAEHSHFESINHFLDSDEDMVLRQRYLRDYDKPRLLGDTREGEEMKLQLAALETLLQAYLSGEITERA